MCGTFFVDVLHMHMSFCMVGGSDKGSRFHVFKSSSQPFFLVQGKGVGMDKFRYFDVHFCGLQVLA